MFHISKATGHSKGTVSAERMKMIFNVWELETGQESESVFSDLNQWEKFYNAQRLASHYDMLDEKWYFYERTEYGIYQITNK